MHSNATNSSAVPADKLLGTKGCITSISSSRLPSSSSSSSSSDTMPDHDHTLAPASSSSSQTQNNVLRSSRVCRGLLYHLMYQSLHEHSRFDRTLCLQLDPAARSLPASLSNVEVLGPSAIEKDMPIPCSPSTYLPSCEKKFDEAVARLQSDISEEVRSRSVLFILSFHHLLLLSQTELSKYISSLCKLRMASICLDLSGASANLLSLPAYLYVARFSDVLVSVDSKNPVKRGSDTIVGEMIAVQRARVTGRVTENSSFLVIELSSSSRSNDGVSASMEFVAPLALPSHGSNSNSNADVDIDPASSSSKSRKSMETSDEPSHRSSATMELVRAPKIVVYDRSDPDFDEDEDYDEDGNLNDEDLDL